MIKPIDLDRAYRLLNIGATTLVSAAHEGDADIMAAAWATALDLTPCKATVVIDKSHYTRKLIEKSGFFALMIPTAAIAPIVMNLGTVSKNDNPRKLEECGTRLVTLPEYDMPLLEGCAAWIVFRVVPELHNQEAYDLFIGEAVAAFCRRSRLRQRPLELRRGSRRLANAALRGRRPFLHHWRRA